MTRLRRSLGERLDAGLAEEVRGLGMPVLVLHGDDDPPPVECATDLAERLPQAHLTVVPGVGHNPWLEDEPAVRTALRHFLTHLPE